MNISSDIYHVSIACSCYSTYMTHSHKVENLTSKLLLSLALNTLFTFLEFAFGFLSGSLALISDAGHNLTDTLSIVISLFGDKMAQKESNLGHSYGYGRVSILTALINSSLLLALSFYIFYTAFIRIFFHPHDVSGPTIMIVSIIGIVINGVITYILSDNKKDLNVKSAYINMLFDTVALVATLIAGILITVTHLEVIDPIISIVIALVVLYGAYKVGREAIHVLLEAVPYEIDSNELKKVILSAEKVKDVDDIHVWAISSHFAALSCEIIIENCELEESIQIVKNIKEQLKHNFHISHATIETKLK